MPELTLETWRWTKPDDDRPRVGAIRVGFETVGWCLGIGVVSALAGAFVVVIFEVIRSEGLTPGSALRLLILGGFLGFVATLPIACFAGACMTYGARPDRPRGRYTRSLRRLVDVLRWLVLLAVAGAFMFLHQRHFIPGAVVALLVAEALLVPMQQQLHRFVPERTPT